MVFGKIKNPFSNPDDKYETLIYKYSKVKLENRQLKEKVDFQIEKYKNDLNEEIGSEFIQLYKKFELIRSNSSKIKNIDTEVQTLLVDLNKIEKNLKDIMKKLSIEEFAATQRYFDPDVHQIASYVETKDTKKGLIVKTVRKGFKINNKIIEKPRVVISK